MHGRSPGPRCQARMGYVVKLRAGLGAASRLEHRTARCHLEHGHAGEHRATVPPPATGSGLTPAARGRIVAFTVGPGRVR